MRGLSGAALLALLGVGAPAGPVLAQEDAPRTEAAGQPAAPSESEAPSAAAESRLPAPSPAPAKIEPAPAEIEAAPAKTEPAPVKAEKPHAPLSPLGMFLGADPVVQGVMILLGLASVATWTVLLVRALALALAKARMRRAIARIRAAESLTAAAEAIRGGVPARLLEAAEEEVDRSPGLPGEGIKERAQVVLGRIEAAAAKRAASGTGLLATIGSTGPFVGLFGTVWGIMHSFIGIAESHTTNLAVVAPGIAEALLATGIGLVAAIPAVVFYNALTRSVAAYRAQMSDAVALILCHLSRDLDRRTFGGGGPRHARLSVAAE